MTKNTFPVHGMHCASCATLITKRLSKLPGVSSCEVNLVAKNAEIDYDHTITNPEQLAQEVKKCGYELVVPVDAIENSNQHAGHVHGDSSDEEIMQMKKKVKIAAPLALISIGIMVWMIGADYERRAGNEVAMVFIHHLLPIFATIMLFVVGRKYVQALGRYMRYGVANMDTLVGIGTVTAFLYSFIVSAFEGSLEGVLDTERLFYEAVIVVIGFITIGKYMELKVMSKTGQAIKALLWLQAKEALILKDGQEITIPLEKVQIGDIMIVKPGEKVPLDGEIVQWKADVDESMITGEPLPVSKKPTDIVIGATIVTNATLQVKATAVGKDTYLSKIIAIVTAAQNSKPQIQKKVDTIMKRFIPTALVVAVWAGLFRLFLGQRFYPSINNLQFAIMSFVGVLVIACPCGLGLATPMAIITGVGHGAKNGVLAKNAEWLLKLRKTKTVVFDKTGTITEGKPQLVEQHSVQGDATHNLQVLASLEWLSSHPIAHAISEYAKQKSITKQEIEDFHNIEGVGVEWSCQGVHYTISKPSYLTTQGIDYDRERIDIRTRQWKTPLILSSQGKVLWYYAVADEIKASSKQAIVDLKKQGIIPVMLTGDHSNTAQYIASQLGIERVYAEVKPEEKADIIRQIQSESKAGNLVTMVGDGINDAPALAVADVGVAMSTGTDVAIESAELTLLHGDLSKLVKAIKISHLSHSAIIQNLVWAFAFNVIGIPLAAGAFYPFLWVLLNPAFEWAAMAFSSLTVVGNSLRLQAKKI